MLKKISLCSLALFGTLVALAGCSSNTGETKTPEEQPKEIVVSVPDGFTAVNINETPYSNKFEGLGAQMDVCLWSGSYCGLDGLDANITDDDVAIWEQRLDYMKMDVTRMCIIPDWYELSNDNNDPNVLNDAGFNWNTVKMQCVEKVLGLCKRHGIKMNMSWYGIYPDSWNAMSGEAGWIVWPKDFSEFAESVYAALDHFSKEGYDDVINEISFYPEPVTSKVRDGSYRSMITAVINKLKKEGVRDKYLVTGPAEVSDYKIFEIVFDEVGDLFDRYTGSFYKFNNSTDNASMNMGIAPFAEKAATVGKSYGISEFGSNLMINAAVQSDIDTYERALYLSRFGINCLSSGYTYASYWVLSNGMYDSTLMDLGLWKYKNKDWALRPQYYTYSLMTRFTDPGSEIYASDINIYGDISFVALKNPNGKWTYLIANNSTSMKKISIVNPYKKSGSFDKYEICEDSIPLDGTTYALNKTTTVNLKNGCTNLALKSKSFVAITDIVY